jgi:hypothetical protein
MKGFDKQRKILNIKSDPFPNTVNCEIFASVLFFVNSGKIVKLHNAKTSTLKPHCIRCSHFKVEDVSALEASSNRSVRIVEDNVTASATYARTLVTAWML